MVDQDLESIISRIASLSLADPLTPDVTKMKKKRKICLPCDQGPVLQVSRRRAVSKQKASADRTPKLPLHITRIPPELQLLIFDLLDPVSSTCFGLTSKYFYNIHRASHGSVGLWERDSPEARLQLGDILTSWIPKQLTYTTSASRFVEKVAMRDGKSILDEWDDEPNWSVKSSWNEGAVERRREFREEECGFVSDDEYDEIEGSRKRKPRD
ncbi:uncharacterized protein PAC_09239 [Phialocephala subalpina]|uniref:F-box domain-containing protein n=1 Tax=Phialocephala subalpina TaxID=576137 RepID=A0A1L7X2Y1_9HELO|nr:uncharacterized protein PAC_09239 [Phialocephala subalpina]